MDLVAGSVDWSRFCLLANMLGSRNPSCSTAGQHRGAGKYLSQRLRHQMSPTACMLMINLIVTEGPGNAAWWRVLPAGRPVTAPGDAMFVTWLFKKFCVPCCTILVLRRRVSAWQVAGCALVLATPPPHPMIQSTMAILRLEPPWPLCGWIICGDIWE